MNYNTLDTHIKKVLVLYFSQSGQLLEIVHSALSPLRDSEKTVLKFAEIKSLYPYPFPWSYYKFFDAFPESALEIPGKIDEIDIHPEDDFDLIILAYQIWYLSPSVPISSFLQSKQAKRIMKGKPVVTIIGARNMWLMAQEKVKKRLNDLGAKPVGNIVLVDRHKNLISIVTIVYWMMTGKKKRFINIFPKPGVSNQDIKGAYRFGNVILDKLLNQDLDTLQTEIRSMGAVRVIPNLIMLEKRGEKIFKIWAMFIRRKGGYGNPDRKLRVKLFSVYLLVAILFLSPIGYLNSKIRYLVNQEKLKKDIDYYSGI
ncbi:MAG: hypothetical protein OQK65_03590 [Chlorobium sp.]|jgi:hypothetical protein|nr:hypothetical protein [Chlorobium sp.]